MQIGLLDQRRTRSNRRPSPLEELEQISLMQWAERETPKHPELALLHHIPNGGHRAKRTAARLKAMGTKRGVLDLDLPVARGGYHGLRIEMKRNDKRARLEPEQAWWIERLSAEGYRCEVCYGWEAARDAITNYLEGTCPISRK